MSLLQTLKTQFLGRKTNDVIDEVTRLCQSHHCTIEIQDPQFNTGNIDVDNSRVVLHQDGEGKIINFTVG